MNVICNLGNILKRKGIKQREFCRKIHVTDSTMSYYCNGQRIPNVVMTLKFAKMLGCRVEDLYVLKE